MQLSTPFHNHALQGKVAVVTGAGGGIGLSIAEHLQSIGAQVVKVDISQPEKSFPQERFLQLQCDISDPASITQMAEIVMQKFGRCDILVNNAAISAAPVALENLPIDLWEKMFHVNLRGAFLCAQALVPMMFEKNSGSIINIASIAAKVATRVGSYGPAKAGMRGLTTQMAVEWGPNGIRANSVSPGMIRTPLSEQHYQNSENLNSRISKIPARRIGVPSDIANIVCFLASDASSYINGEDFVVDGGFLKASLKNLY